MLPFAPAATVKRLRPLAYAIGNLVEPDYAAAAFETQRLSRAPAVEVRRSVRRRLWRYLRYCLTYSKFWQARWPRECLRFQEEEAEDVLLRLPPLTKDDLRRHGSSLRIDPAYRVPGDGYPPIRGPFRNFSGGSTGVP